MTTELIIQGVIASIILIGYIVLTALGHDGNTLLALLGGQAIGGITGHVVRNGN